MRPRPGSWTVRSSRFSSLPSIAGDDIAGELDQLARALAARGYPLFTVDTTHPELGPGRQLQFRARVFAFRERTPAASLGLFTGRILAEQADPATADKGLAKLAELYPSAPFVPFFEGLLSLRLDDPEAALPQFACAEALQPLDEDRALAAFYQAYALSLLDEWEAVEPHLDRAIAACPEVKEYCNLRGVARFKAGRYREAADDFQAALALDAGSAMDLANLGLCHLRLDHPEQAAHYLGAALELDASLDFARAHLERLLGEGIAPNNTATGSHT